MPHNIEELEPTEEDLGFAQWLIEEGFQSVSNKYRTVAKMPASTKAEDLIRPEVLGTPAGRELARIWKQHEGHYLRCHAADNIELTVKQYRAFKQLGGRTA